MLLKGKVALVTGASRGIGEAIAKLFAKEGARVVVNYKSNKDKAERVVTDINKDGGKAIAIQADVRSKAEVIKLIEKTEGHFNAIDIMVLNASINFKVLPFVEYPWDSFESKLVDEIRAVFFPCKAVIPSMVDRKKGNIIIISSSLSRFPGDGFSVHSVAKSALDAFGKSLALELGPNGIRVNVVAPGLTLTDATSFLNDVQKKAIADMIPLRRNALPDDIAGAVLMIACDHSKFITGTYAQVNGGIQMI